MEYSFADDKRWNSMMKELSEIRYSGKACASSAMCAVPSTYTTTVRLNPIGIEVNGK